MSRTIADLLFDPRSIVVYGASADPDKLSGRPLDYLKRFGYAGEIFAVNPRRDEVQGYRAYDTVGEVPGPVDLAVIVVPAEKIVDAVAECAAAGVRAATMFASGFAEAPGGVGEADQERIAEIARASGMRLLGPNCLGAFALGSKAFATFSTAFDAPGDLPDGPVALVTQSGAVGTFTYSTMTAAGLGVRYFANPGNQSDITVAEVLDSLVYRNDVEILLGHMEDFTDPAALERLASRAKEAGKSLVLLKAGRSHVGARAVAAHTGSVAGDDAEFDRILAAHGAVRVRSMEEMRDLAILLAAGRRPRGRRVSVFTQSGGAGALVGDQAVDLGLEMEPWADEHRTELAAMLPFFASTANPLDMTGAMLTDVGILDKALEIACTQDVADVILVVLGNSDKAGPAVVEVCAKHFASTDKPFVVTWTGGSGAPLQGMVDAGIPGYTEPSRAVAAIAQMVQLAEHAGVPAS